MNIWVDSEMEPKETGWKWVKTPKKLLTMLTNEKIDSIW